MRIEWAGVTRKAAVMVVFMSTSWHQVLCRRPRIVYGRWGEMRGTGREWRSLYGVCLKFCQCAIMYAMIVLTTVASIGAGL